MTSILVALAIASGLVATTDGEAAAAADSAAAPVAAATDPTPALIDAALDGGRIDLDSATRFRMYALTGDARLPQPYRSAAPWHGTLADRDITAALPSVSPATRAAVEQRRRGPVPGVNPCGFSVSALPFTRVTEHFYIEYGALGPGLTIDDYAEALEVAWVTQVDEFGWAAPPPDLEPPFSGRYHVRIDVLPGGIYGFVSGKDDVGDNPATTWDEGDAYTSCMGLNNDYNLFPGTPLQAMQATAAHEFNHSIQFGYGTLFANEPGHEEVDSVFSEGGATWMEDQVFDDSDDSYNYLWPRLDDGMGEHDGSPYAYWIVFQSLTERFGVLDEQAFQHFWEQESRNLRRGVQALAYGVGRQGVSLRYAFHHGAIALAHVAQCSARVSLPYCFEEGDGYRAAAGRPARTAVLAAGATFSRSIEDHYATHLVQLPGRRTALPLDVTNTSTEGKLRASVVCEHNQRLIIGSIGLVAPGTTARFTDAAAANCDQPVLVVTNETVRTGNPDTSTFSGYRVVTAAS